MIAKRKQATQTQEKFEQNLRNQTIQAAKIGRELGYLECFIEFAHEYGCIDIEKISEEDYQQYLVAKQQCEATNSFQSLNRLSNITKKLLQ